MMCDDCATFALHCGSIVCLDCETHSCSEEVCDQKLLVNLKVKNLLEIFCGEKLSGSENWERMGEAYDPASFRDLSPRPFTSLYSFPQILDVRVYGIQDYSKTAHQIWRLIRVANHPARTVQEYNDRLNKMTDYEFVCWYQYRVESPYSTFEDRVFIKSSGYLKNLHDAYYDNRLAEEVQKVRDRLTLKSE